MWGTGIFVHIPNPQRDAMHLCRSVGVPIFPNHNASHEHLWHGAFSRVPNHTVQQHHVAEFIEKARASFPMLLADGAAH